MTIPSRYAQTYLPVKLFLSSYRAFKDGQSAVNLLEADLEKDVLSVSDWKIHWVAACTLLRTSIDLFRADAKICVSKELADAMKQEWSDIKRNEDQHEIFWGFLREERNNILHEYKWSAYKRFLNSEGEPVTQPISLLSLYSEDYTPELIVRFGKFKGRNAFDVVKKAEAWVGERIYSAIGRADLNPEEDRNIVTFTKRSKSGPDTLG